MRPDIASQACHVRHPLALSCTVARVTRHRGKWYLALNSLLYFGDGVGQVAVLCVAANDDTVAGVLAIFGIGAHAFTDVG
jgi:hypothetical protein